jgi:uncharacterized membrane protein
MRSIIDNPRAALGAGVGLTVFILIAWMIGDGGDALGLISFLIRVVHVLAAMVWVGLIVFVNFVQLVALRSADEQGRTFLHKAVVPAAAWWFRHASTVAVASGVLLLVVAGYLLPSLAYGSGVYVPTGRAVLLWGGVIGALAMWMFVHMYIWPSMQVVLGIRPGDANVKAQARARVAMFARLNLVIAIPVTLVMVAAAHLY